MAGRRATMQLQTLLRQRMSPLLAPRLRHAVMSDLSPLSGVEQKLDFRAVRFVDDHPKRTFPPFRQFR
jgi:hypothetical protein